jgi:hypothetical protein
MKHLDHTLETYVYSHCNMCNISIYFCNINIKHLQHLKHLKHTLQHAFFSIVSPCCLDECRLVDLKSSMPAWRSTPVRSGRVQRVGGVQCPRRATPVLEKAAADGRVRCPRRGDWALPKWGASIASAVGNECCGRGPRRAGASGADWEARPDGRMS